MKRTLAAVILSVGLTGLSHAQEISLTSLEEKSVSTEQKNSCKPRQMHRKRFLLKKLPVEKRELFFSTMAEVKNQSRPLKKEIKVIKKQLKNLLTSEVFDEAAFTEKSAQIGPKKKEIASIRQGAVVKLASSFDQNERKILAKVLKIKCHKNMLSF